MHGISQYYYHCGTAAAAAESSNKHPVIVLGTTYEWLIIVTRSPCIFIVCVSNITWPTRWLSDLCRIFFSLSVANLSSSPDARPPAIKLNRILTRAFDIFFCGFCGGALIGWGRFDCSPHDSHSPSYLTLLL